MNIGVYIIILKSVEKKYISQLWMLLKTSVKVFSFFFFSNAVFFFFLSKFKICLKNKSKQNAAIETQSILMQQDVSQGHSSDARCDNRHSPQHKMSFLPCSAWITANPCLLVCSQTVVMFDRRSVIKILPGFYRAALRCK